MSWCSIYYSRMRLRQSSTYLLIFARGYRQIVSLAMKFILCCSLLLMISTSLMAQRGEQMPRKGSRIIDDTTKQIYGPTTSKYYYEQDVFNNRMSYHPIDTVIKNFHRWNYVQANNNFYQDLGNIGTAIRSIYYQAPEVIGARSGFESFDLYWNTEQVKYYDTKSPYSNMRVILGGKGRSMTRATFSRNINPRWNFGLTYRGLFIDKQIQRKGKGDRIARSNYYDFYTAFQSKDSTYRLFVNYRRNFIQVDEYGGIRNGEADDFPLKNFFQVNVSPWLTAAESNDMRNNLHLFHQYEIGKALQVYHVADRYRQTAKFVDVPGQEPPDFFHSTIIDSANTSDISEFRAFRNEMGIKGNLAKLFYNGYYALRHYSMEYNHFPSDSILISTNGTESYIGGRMSLHLDSIGEVGGWAEIMQDGNYRIQGDIKSKWFEASLKQLQYAPSFAQQAYRGAHHRWSQAFDDVQVTQVNGYLHYRSKSFSLSPGLTFTRLRNYVFFKKFDAESDTIQQVFPVQSTGNQVIVSPEVRLGITLFRHISFTSQVIYTQVIENSEQGIQLPNLFINSQLSYYNIFFNGNLDMHAGLDLHYKSDYYALAYDPAIRQFYVQQNFKTPAFPLVDIFFNAKIKRGRIFIKYNNLVQAFTKQGYLPTPYYPGQRSILDFGFDWSFYD
jgi:hypothetical protein